MNPQPPKTEADQKIENHFNGIVLTILAVIALAVLIAIVFLLERGPKAAPSTHRQRAGVSIHQFMEARLVAAESEQASVGKER